MSGTAHGPIGVRQIRYGVGELQHALTSRVIIEQAKGVPARAHDVDVDRAFDLLRRYARNHNLKLLDLARIVAADPADPAGLTGT